MVGLTDSLGLWGGGVSVARGFVPDREPYLDPRRLWLADAQGLDRWRSFAMPHRGRGGPEYVEMHGSLQPRGRGASSMMVSPMELRHLDVRSGELLRVRPPVGERRLISTERARGASVAASRMSPLVQVLVPSFFLPARATPECSTAGAHETALFTAEHTELLPWYEEMAPDWCEWVGVSARLKSG